GTKVEAWFEIVVADLKRRGIRFRPHLWISDEWFTPDGIPGIAVPFYLAHPRLARLESKQILEVEGGTRENCMRILRHEMGHAIDNAFNLRRRPRRRKIFGDPSKPYPEYYSPRPFSRRFVLHLDSWYAQSHPDEDFAETFGVWLAPRANWRQRYAGWPALKKIEYMDELMAELATKKPVVTSRRKIDAISTMTKTLRTHYEEKRSRYSLEYPSFYDRDLRRLFSADPEHKRHPAAAAFLQKMRQDIRQRVAHWTGTHAYTIDQVLKEMSLRCRELGLRMTENEEDSLVDCTVMLTVQTMNYLHSGRHRVAL
ncbi:MAG: putative zinc-binding metallopeptidase, partial [Planctomycetes bacterium]|nr:putative zinc-binding metallopeptidase [Planctomycetota bacterium]